MSCVGGVFLFVKPVSVAQLGMRIVTGEVVGHHFLVCVTEINVAHIFLVVKQVGVKRVVVPEVVLVVLSFPVAKNHIPEEACHSEQHIGPESWPHHVEPRPERAKYFVARVC